MVCLWIVALVMIMRMCTLATCGELMKGKFSRISSVDYPATSLNCQFHPVRKPPHKIACAAICKSSDCDIFGVESGSCVVCQKVNPSADNPLGPLPFDTMYESGECPGKYHSHIKQVLVSKLQWMHAWNNLLVHNNKWCDLQYFTEPLKCSAEC